MQILGVPDPAWTLRRLDGTAFTLGELRGRPVFVNLWATWCPPCVEELASIDRLAREVGEEAVHFVLASPEDAARVRAFAELNDHDLPLVVEETLAPEAFGELVLPTTVILDSEGRMVLRHRGAAEWDTPEVQALLRTLAGEGVL
jgi:thiol-disulfide isomerase/thioredoxin